MKKLEELRSLRKSIVPVSIPINLLYDETLKRCQYNDTVLKTELNVIILALYS